MRTLQPEVTEGPRRAILGCVTKCPGVHLRSIERRTELPLGQVLYHLDRLERMGLVVSQRDAGFRRYYLAGEVGRFEKKYLAALRHEVPRKVLLLLLERPGLVHKELQASVGVAGSTLSFHLQRLVDANVVVRRRENAANRYHVNEPDLARRVLVYYRESFQDEAVDRFVRRALDALSAPPSSPAASAEPVPA